MTRTSSPASVSSSCTLRPTSPKPAMRNGPLCAQQRAADQLRRGAFERVVVADQLEHASPARCACRRRSASRSRLRHQLPTTIAPLSRRCAPRRASCPRSDCRPATRISRRSQSVDLLHARHARADAIAGVRRERGGDDVPRRVRRGRAGELHRLAVRRLFDEGVDLAAEAALPRAEDQRRVLFIAAVRDDAPAPLPSRQASSMSSSVRLKTTRSPRSITARAAASSVSTTSVGTSCRVSRCSSVSTAGP